ncbi:MAG: 4a-hydroxytetrahydrobiopterin dehydratase [Methanobacterium sp.]|nr:4a-hydroxytetrahydrobiopterin dehydratase [Methanobacterium sp.]
MNLPPLLSKDEVLKKASKLRIWKLIDEHHLVGVFKFKDFNEALEFTVKVGEIADKMNHHPEINLSWGRVEIIIFTHDRDGLTEWDFQFAEEVNKIHER